MYVSQASECASDLSNITSARPHGLSFLVVYSNATCSHLTPTRMNNGIASGASIEAACAHMNMLPLAEHAHIISLPQGRNSEVDDARMQHAREMINRVNIASDVELELRMGRCGLSVIDHDNDSGGGYYNHHQPHIYTAPHRIIGIDARSYVPIPAHSKYGSFASDVGEPVFAKLIVQFVQLESLLLDHHHQQEPPINDDDSLPAQQQQQTTRNAENSDYDENAAALQCFLASSSWIRSEEITVYGDLTNSGSARKVRALVDSSSDAHFTVNAYAFDYAQESGAARALFEYLHCAPSTLLQSPNGMAWKVNCIAMEPNQMRWMTLHTPPSALPQPLCIKKDAYSESIMGATISQMADIKIGMCQEVNVTWRLPTAFMYACTSIQRARILATTNLADALPHDRVSTSAAVAAVVQQSSIAPTSDELAAVANELVAHGDVALASILGSGGGTHSSPTNAPPAASAQAAPPPAGPKKGRGRPPKNPVVVVPATIASAATITAPVPTILPPAPIPVPIVQVRRIPPVTRIKCRKSFLFNALACQSYDGSSNPIMEAAHAAHDMSHVDVWKRPLWRVDFTMVWQSDRFLQAKLQYEAFMRQMNTDGGSDITSEEIRPVYEVEIECVDPVYWTSLLMSMEGNTAGNVNTDMDVDADGNTSAMRRALGILVDASMCFMARAFAHTNSQIGNYITAAANVDGMDVFPPPPLLVHRQHASKQ